MSLIPIGFQKPIIHEISECLYIGNKESRKLVEDRGIETVIEIGSEEELKSYSSELPLKSEVRVISIDLPDDRTEKLHLDSVLEIIEKSLKLGNGRTLVHCNAGVSRSSSFVLAYLIETGGMTLREALDHMNKIRQGIYTHPNIGFLFQLLQFERRIHGKNSMTLMDYLKEYS